MMKLQKYWSFMVIVVNSGEFNLFSDAVVVRWKVHIFCISMISKRNINMKIKLKV